MNWLVFTLLAMFSVAIADLAQRVSLKNKINLSSETNNFYIWGSMGLCSLLFAFIIHLPIPADFYTPKYWLSMAVLAVIYFWGGTFYYTSFKSNSVSLSTILGTISSIITTFLGIILFEESTDSKKFVGAVIILTAIFIVHVSRKSKLDKFNLYGLVGGSLYGLAYTADKLFVINVSPHFHQIILCFSVALVSLVFRSNTIISETKKINLQIVKSMTISVIFFFLYQKFIFYAYTIGGEVGRIDIFNNATIFIIILLEVLIFKDKSRLKTKIFSSTLAVIGAILLTIAS